MKEVKLSSLMQQVRGLSYKKENILVNPKVGYYPVFRANNIGDSAINLEKLVFAPVEIIKPKQLLKKGDVLIAASSGSLSVVGKAALIRKDLQATFGAFCKVLRPELKHVSFNYFSFFFQTTYYRRTISSLAEGANINNLKTEHLDELKIPLPPLPVQKQIAAILDAADDLRQKDKALIGKYEDLGRSVFLEMFGDPVRNEKGWEKVKLKNFAKVQIGPFGSQLHKSDYISGGIPLINPMHLKNMKIVADAGFSISAEKFAQLPNYHLQKDDIIMARRGEMGRCALVTKKESNWFCGTGSLYLRPSIPLNSEYLLFAMTSSSSIRYFENEAQGVTMANLNKGILHGLGLALPPLSLQNKFAAIIEEIEAQKKQAKAALEKSEALFQCLLQRAFRGDLVAE